MSTTLYISFPKQPRIEPATSLAQNGYFTTDLLSNSDVRAGLIWKIKGNITGRPNYFRYHYFNQHIHVYHLIPGDFQEQLQWRILHNKPSINIVTGYLNFLRASFSTTTTIKLCIFGYT